MDVITGLFGFFNHVIDAVEFLFFGMIAAIVAISILPKDNPLHALLVSLTKHLAATFAIGIVALPLQPLPGIDVTYDTGSMLFLLYYWGSFAYKLMSDSSPLRRHAPTIDGEATASAPRGFTPRHSPAGTPQRRASTAFIDAEAADEPFYDTLSRH